MFYMKFLLKHGFNQNFYPFVKFKNVDSIMKHQLLCWIEWNFSKDLE